jgi:hypothetical protein
LNWIESITREICGETYLTCSKIIPIINCLQTKIAGLDPVTDIAKKMKEGTLTEIKKRFGAIKE